MDLLYNFYSMHWVPILTLLVETFDIKFLLVFVKMTGKGGAGGVCIFPELGEVLGCYMQNFRSLAQSLHIDIFCKIDGGGGGPL